jgi:signal transduction histidine kinase
MGLSVIRNGKARTLSVEQGLPCANIYTLTDTDEALWLYSECGAIELRHSELERWWNDPAVRPRVKVLDTLDGIRPAATAATLITPGSSHSKDGRVWFANSSVLQMIDPRAKLPRVALLPVRIEQLVADGTTYPLSHEVVLPPLIKDVQLDYTSPHFASPQRLRFRYKLEGLEETWVEAGNRRQAFFTNLRPGVYTFHVSAAAGDLPWTAASAVRFRIPPVFYQTTWFTLLWMTCALLGVLMVLRWRIEAAKRDQRARLQVRLDERERIARDLHDTLFQNIQGVLLTIDNSTNTLAEEHPTRHALKDALRLSDQIMAESRKRVMELRSEDLDRRSIGGALSQVGSDLGTVYAPAPVFRVIELGTPEDLHPIVFEEVFHVCREALFNAFRHANARRVEAEVLFTRDTFSVRITDDGTGIDERVLNDGGKPGHFGLKGMLERAEKIGARLAIRSRPRVGTEIELSIPKTVACGPRSKGSRAGVREW